MSDRQQKEPFTVWEVQAVTEWRAFRYELRAGDFDDAVERIQAGEAGPIDAGTVGETEFGDSGFALSRTEAVEALDRALRRPTEKQEANIDPS